jgi:hypothetical protein
MTEAGFFPRLDLGFWGSIELSSGRRPQGFITEGFFAGLPWAVVRVPALTRPFGATSTYDPADWDNVEMFPLGLGSVVAIKFLSEEDARSLVLPTEPAPPMSGRVGGHWEHLYENVARDSTRIEGLRPVVECTAVGNVHPDEIGKVHGPANCPSCDQAKEPGNHHYVRNRASRRVEGDPSPRHDAEKHWNLSFWFQCLHCDTWAEPSLEASR